MRVAAVQFRGRDHADPLSALVRRAREAAEGSDLVVLPEMATTGYTFPSREAVASVAEPARGPTFEALAPVARAHRTWLVAGFPEADGDALFNAAMVLDPTGELAFVYRKTLLYTEDLHWATPGDSGYRRFDTEAGSFGVGICMDLNDEGFVGWCRREDVDAIAFPTNWVEEGEPVWPYWAWRLWGCRAALVAANTWGSEGRVAFSGKSAVMQDRVVLAAAPVTGDAVIRATLASASGQGPG